MSKQVSKPGAYRRQKRQADRCSPKADWATHPKVQLRAFKLQQLNYTLLELELPRLRAPDLPSNGSSLRDLDCTHSNYQTQSARARPRHIPANTWKVGTDADLTVIFCPETNMLSGTEFLRVTAIIFPQPRSQQTAYSPLRTMHKLCKDARITSAG
ncbi:hypothetical protein YC2023_108252 [Brassica napus]